MTQKPFASLATRHALPLYFAVAFGAAWTCWLLAIAAERGLLVLPLSSGALQVLGAFAPLAAALFVTWQSGTTREFLQRGWRLKVGLRWYLFALFAPAVLMIAAIAIHVALGGVAPTFPLWHQWPLVVVNFVAVLLIGGPLGEEFGWRGFALPRLQEKLGFWGSSVALGVIWALWHLPLFWLDDAPQNQIPFVLFFLMTIPLSVLFAWLFNKTGGSVLLAMLFHGAVNTWSGPLRILPSSAGSLRPYEIAVVLMWIATLFLYFQIRKNQLTGRRSETGIG